MRAIPVAGSRRSRPGPARFAVLALATGTNLSWTCRERLQFSHLRARRPSTSVHVGRSLSSRVLAKPPASAPVAVLLCCTSRGPGEQAWASREALLAHNRQDVHPRPSPQVTVPGRPPGSAQIQACCGTSVLYGSQLPSTSAFRLPTLAGRPHRKTRMTHRGQSRWPGAGRRSADHRARPIGTCPAGLTACSPGSALKARSTSRPATPVGPPGNSMRHSL